MTHDAHRSKTVVVTGGGRGLGRAVAERVVEDGHRVVILCRDREKGGQAATETGARLLVGDLSDVAGVRGAAAALAESLGHIDVLVHNAGIWPSRREVNADGFEQAYFTNHLAPFLLNHLLEQRLDRVVQVSAGLYATGRVDPDRTPTGEDFSGIRTYADTKLANLLMLPLWAQRWQDAGVSIDAVHPGVLRTGLGDRSGLVGMLLSGAKRLWNPASTGAGPVVRLIVSRGTGRYFHETTEQKVKPLARDGALARRLWDDAVRALDVA